MSIRNLDAILKPRAVAVVGATDRAGAVGGLIFRNILAAGFKGPVYPINISGASVSGRPGFTTFGQLPSVPDLAIIATPPATVPGLIGEAAAKGVRGAVVITAGFGEGDQAEGRALQDAALAAARPALLRIVGPNCFGVAAPHVNLNASFGLGAIRPGKIGFITQSGAMMATVMDWAAPRGIGFSAAVSVGDMADVDFGDLLDWMCLDTNTSAILLYVEAITHPRKFMSAARAAARMKPVIVMKSGRHEISAKAATSHTGALAGSDVVYDAAFARAGLLRVRTIQQLFDTVALLATGPTVKGERLAIVTNGGGAGVLALDDLLDRGGAPARLDPQTITRLDKVLPPTWSHGNPVDIIGDAGAERYLAALDAVLADDGVDAVAVLYCPTAASDPAEVARALAAHCTRASKPILTTWLGDASVQEARGILTDAGLPTFSTPEDAIEGFHNLHLFVKRREALMEVPPVPTIAAPAAVSAVASLIGSVVGERWLGPQDCREILRNYGIPMNDSHTASTPAEAAALAARIQGPVALKIRSRDILHKSDVGGVILNLSGAEATRRAAEGLLSRVQAQAPKAVIDGFTIEPMIHRPHATELLLGMTVDRTFGPVVAFGRGGIAVEVIRDQALGLPPLNLNLARAMISETQVGKLLRGYRGEPPADLDAIARALVSLSQLVIDHPTIADIDINPLLADADGIVGVDARIRVKPLNDDRDRLVICPYPQHLERTLTLRNGKAIYLRPLRPDDEPQVETFVRNLNPDDARFRFFASLHGLGHPMAARLCQLDYDREIALIAFPAEQRDSPWGIVRMHADANGERAEFAVTIASAAQGQGLGYVLMQQVLDLARARGIGELWGQVLTDNHRMRKMCDELGFVTRLGPAGDATVVCSRKP